MMFYLLSLGCGSPLSWFLQKSQIFLYIPPVSHERILCVFHVSLTKNAPGKSPTSNGSHGFSLVFTSSEVNADDHGNWTQDLGGHTAMSEWNPRS